MWAHSEIDLARYPVVCLMFYVGGAKKCSKALGLESLDPFLSVSRQGPRLTTIMEGGGDRRPVQLDLACEADGGAAPVPVQPGHRCYCLGNPHPDL